MENIKLAEVVQDKYYTLQYRVKYPDGTLSEDYYNLTRAKEFVKKINLGVNPKIGYESIGGKSTEPYKNLNEARKDLGEAVLRSRGV